MKIEQSILEIIEQGKTEGNLYFLPNLRLERKIYLKVNKVLTILGGNWNRKTQGHVFETDISERIDDVLLTGQVIDRKKEFQFFETPLNIASSLVEFAEIKPLHRCLEPSAGRGNIAELARDIVGNDSVVCVEKMPENVAILTGKGFSVEHVDFLQYASGSELEFDRVIMNPPFANQQDIAHVDHALSFLKIGGILVSVMSAGMKFRKNARACSFWEKIKEYDWDVFDLPPNSFKISGTGVNAIVLKIQKCSKLNSRMA